MVLRVVCDPMLEKSNRTGPLEDRKKVLLMTRFRVFLFLGFLTTRETGIFQNFLRIPQNSRKFSREIFSSLIILTFFLIISILLCCFDKLSLRFSIFSTDLRKTFDLTSISFKKILRILKNNF